MAKMICPNAKLNESQLAYTKLECDDSCGYCHGKAFYDEEIIEICLIEEFITDNRTYVYDYGAMIYAGDLKQFAKDMSK